MPIASQHVVRTDPITILEPFSNNRKTPKNNTMSEALGMIGVQRLCRRVVSDAMVVAANVRLVKTIPIGGGMITVLAQGDVGSVKAAVDVGQCRSAGG